MDSMSKMPIAHRFRELSVYRKPYDMAAYVSSLFTVPRPELLSEQPTPIIRSGEVPDNSLGTEGVQHLAGLMTANLFPPGQPFISFRVKPGVAAGKNQITDEDYSALEEAISDAEGLILTEFERVDDTVMSYSPRQAMMDAIWESISTGSSVVWYTPEKKYKVYRMPNFVVVRDSYGEPKEIILVESVSNETLVRLDPMGPNLPDDTLYTHFLKKKDHWEWCQEKGDQPGPKGTYPHDELRVRPVCWQRITGEHYGRSFMEAFLGDFESLSVATKALNWSVQAAATIFPIAKPGAYQLAADMANKPPLSVLTGNADDVVMGPEQRGQSPLQYLLNRVDTLEQKMRRRFLMYVEPGNRDRVTAAEIQQTTRLLENTLGPAYMSMGASLQAFVGSIILDSIDTGSWTGAMKKLTDKIIVTGASQLSHRRLGEETILALQAASSVLGHEAVSGAINTREVVARMLQSHGVQHRGLLKSRPQMEQETAQAQQQQVAQTMLEKGTAPMATAMAGTMTGDEQSQ